jgi:hypothetical protein
MKRIAPWLVSGMALFCVAAQAADMGQASVRRVYTDSVAPADQQAYEAGVKTFNKCLADHGFKYRWTAWLHETGDTHARLTIVWPLWPSFEIRQQSLAALSDSLGPDQRVDRAPFSDRTAIFATRSGRSLARLSIRLYAWLLAGPGKDKLHSEQGFASEFLGAIVYV